YKVHILHVINKQTRSYLKKNELETSYIEEKLNAYREKYEKESGIRVETATREGSIFTEINQYAADCMANMMILGTHGKQGFQHLFGSYALKVVLDSPCPVVVVQKRSFGKGYHDILFPLSNELEPRQKIQWAMMIARLFDSRIHIFQANEKDPGLNSRLKIIGSQITQVFTENKVPYLQVTADKPGDFASQVLEYGIKTQVDLIMIMTVPFVDVPGFSVAAWDEKMMFNEAQIPVMCVNPTELGQYYYEFFSLY
ncbi:MAG TPA: universal stress protein, partial [Bacteroidales bacterium]|nr:universal stress protein [Bacteroidales bacterium]